MAGCRGLVSALLAVLAVAACSESPTQSSGASGAAGAPEAGASDGGAADGSDHGGASEGGASDGGASDGYGGASEGGASDGGASDGYAGAGSCTPGVPRCHGDFGYQMCEQDGSWSESRSCAGYSLNGTSSYCFDIPSPEGELWATCLDPACWYWMERGVDLADVAVGSCASDGQLRRCLPGGSLSLEACAGACTQVGSLDGRALGFCASVCEDGARECLGGSLYRECSGGRWRDETLSCSHGDPCHPASHGALPDIRCGGVCEPGTTRCRADRLAVEACTPAGEWQLERACMLGRCTPAGPQAECQTECSDGQRSCAFDGAASERVCDESGAWGAEQSCSVGTSCRLDGTLALGCVACVGATTGGNAFGVSDARCVEGQLQTCGDGHSWQPAAACPDAGECAELVRGASSVAACSAP
jgi:hypothetical protein